jgi:hypothetical protein
MTREELLKLIEQVYEAMFSEYMYCPFCSGHIGYKDEGHDDYCQLYKALKEAGHKFTFTETAEE